METLTNEQLTTENLKLKKKVKRLGWALMFVSICLMIAANTHS